MARLSPAELADPGAGGLHHFLHVAAREHPDRVALVVPGGPTCTYAQLARGSTELAEQFIASGLGPGDRIGVCMRKSIESVTAIFAALEVGAAYVPVDPDGPLPRAAFILEDCSVSAIVVDESVAGGLFDELDRRASAGKAGLASTPARFIRGSAGFERVASGTATGARSRPLPVEERIAYILYTSGSTGEPKGVVLTHRNATSFLDWCTHVFQPTPADCFSSHAPFHFDLSILDIFLAVKHAARLVLFGRAERADPRFLVQSIGREGISIWYSTPAVLRAMLAFGGLERHEFPSLRLLLFAGEVFPIQPLRMLMSHLPAVRAWNLYGPTETNVCFGFAIPSVIPQQMDRPFPIGFPCSNARSSIVGADGRPVSPGEPGLLLIRGDGVMSGYWNRPELTAAAFHVDADGAKWYRTGDLVREDETGAVHFIGRNDRMVKRRGYRIELDEIENALAAHPLLEHAAVIATGGEVKILACYTTQSKMPLPELQLREFLSVRLPASTLPDAFISLEEIPLTSTHKVDYQALRRLT